MPSLEKVGVIGVGKMGEALVSGLLRSSKYSPSDIYVYDVIPDRLSYMKSKYGVQILDSIADVVSAADIVTLVVKPQDLLSVTQELNKTYLKDRIILSLAAGINTAYLSKNLQKYTEIVRCMPNLACSVGEGMICVTRAQGTSQESLDRITKILSLTGHAVQIDEKFLDAATGLSGSGPAYVYTFIEALADAGVRLGLKRDLAFTLAAQTTLGAGKMVVETGEHPAKLKDMVVTPGGTTIEGLVELEKGGLRATVIEAVSKAAERSRQLQAAASEKTS
ncbi:MAG: pyrroline-5-carboxylate reductase [Thaumarchaeota archaeon]|nr:pyrroline-5-carboxylate reductase [Nitrososphaerota archaeon]MCL5318074.1 pyrroline-5-carboxylate reductase [Nitrososphaerota archaeon]